MFLGQHRLFLESDRRLVIPEPFRAELKECVYITRGFELNLLIVSSAAFREIYERVRALNIADPQARLLNRLILGNASKLDISSSGHIRIPETLLSVASLENEVVLVGQGNYFELWAPAHWEQQSTILQAVEGCAERFAKLNLAL
jgi:MraZ protein